MSGPRTFLLGVNPDTGVCELIGINATAAWRECRKRDLIAVPVCAAEACRRSYREVVTDILALANESA